MRLQNKKEMKGRVSKKGQINAGCWKKVRWVPMTTGARPTFRFYGQTGYLSTY